MVPKFHHLLAAAILLLAGSSLSTPIPRPRLYASPEDNEPEPAVISKRSADLEPQGTIGLNVFASPLGSSYSGIGAVNPYSIGPGSIGTAYGVNQLNTGGLGGLGGLGGYGGVGGLGGGLGAGGYYGGAAGGLGGFGAGGYYGAAAGLNGLGGGLGGLGPGGFGGVGGLGGLGGGLGGLGGYPLGGGLGGIGGGYPLGGGLGGIYSEGDSRRERIRRKLIRTLEKLNRRASGNVGVQILQNYLSPYGGYGGGFGGGYGSQLGIGIAQGGLPFGGGVVG